MEATEDRVLSITEAARRLQISTGTLRRWADEGSIRVIKLPSGVRRFEPTEIERKRKDLGFS